MYQAALGVVVLLIVFKCFFCFSVFFCFCCVFLFFGCLFSCVCIFGGGEMSLFCVVFFVLSFCCFFLWPYYFRFFKDYFFVWLLLFLW